MEIYCEDLFPMDLGTGGWTEFKMTPDVTAYIANNLELFNCETGLIHSHHTMGAFFSGQDTKTLNIEGNDTNCFVSLIVDTRGTYQAAITRKMQRKTEIVTRNLGKSYEFFGEGVVSDNLYDEESKEVTDTVIEYFMLDVQREETSNPLDYLDARFEEIEANKKAAQAPVFVKDSAIKSIPQSLTIDDSEDFYSYLHSGRKTSAEAKEAILFDKDTMDEMVDTTKWNPDTTIIHYLVCQLLTCSLIVNKDIDLKQWVVKHMDKKYDQIFSGGNSIEFTNWADFYVEFIINHYSDENLPEEVYEDWDTYIAKIAGAILDEVGEYPSNDYLEGYAKILNNYIFG